MEPRLVSPIVVSFWPGQAETFVSHAMRWLLDEVFHAG